MHCERGNSLRWMMARDHRDSRAAESITPPLFRLQRCTTAAQHDCGLVVASQQTVQVAVCAVTALEGVERRLPTGTARDVSSSP
jgi:hypothetical protein